MLKSKLQPMEVKLAHQTVHITSQRYRFNGKSLEEAFLDRETNKMTTAILPRLDMSRNHALALRYAPKNRGGLDLPDFYVIQGTTRIRQAIRHIQLNSTVGKNLHIHLQKTQQRTGLQTGILTDTKTNLQYILPNWWLGVLKFLHHIQGNIQMEDAYTITPLQTEDYSIMEEILKGNWSTKTKKMINACRLYLRVTYMLELTNNKKTLPQQIQTVTHRTDMSYSTLTWPEQPQPNKRAWKAWRDGLKTLCKEDGITLRRPLTNEWKPRNQHNRTWLYIYDEDTDIIYNTYTLTNYYSEIQTRRQRWYAKGQSRMNPPSTGIPVIPRRDGQYLVLHREQTGSTIQDNRMERSEKIPCEYAVSDGSVKNGSGTLGWVLASEKSIIKTSYGRVTGVPGNMTSFRTEA